MGHPWRPGARFRGSFPAAAQQSSRFVVGTGFALFRYGQSRAQFRLLIPPENSDLRPVLPTKHPRNETDMSRRILTAGARVKEPIEALLVTAVGAGLLAALAIASAFATV